MRVFIPRFLGALAYLIGLALVGVVGYILIEGWEIHDALYMSVITITAVGYSEVIPPPSLAGTSPWSSWPGALPG
jgi:voltage-gated potassium channel